MSVQDNVQTVSQQIEHLPGEILFSLARNESGLPEFRKAAVKIMLDKGFKQAGHPELSLFVAEIRKEQEAEGEVEAIVEAAIEQPIPPGPFRASVTTKTMQADEVIVRNPLALNEDAIAESVD